MGVRPPGVEENFEDCNLYTQCSIIAYNDIREYEEAEILGATLGKGARTG